MNLFTRLRDFFRPLKYAPRPSTLRNKPMGMAYVRMSDYGDGAEQMNNRVVRTLYEDGTGFWLVDPPQSFIAQSPFPTESGYIAPGSAVHVKSIHDRCLIPIPEIGDDERTQEQEFQPKVPEGGRVVA
jgi:hypothetical protein